MELLQMIGVNVREMTKGGLMKVQEIAMLQLLDKHKVSLQLKNACQSVMKLLVARVSYGLM